MRKIIVLLLLLGIIVSGCIQNPLKQVPVVKVNITFMEKEGIFFAQNYTMAQGTVDYAARPRTSLAKSFPAIAGRTIVMRNNTKTTMNATGPWETLSFYGNGTYNFNLGFNEDYYPKAGDVIAISVIVSNVTGRRIGYVPGNVTWE